MTNQHVLCDLFQRFLDNKQPRNAAKVPSRVFRWSSCNVSSKPPVLQKHQKTVVVFEALFHHFDAKGGNQSCSSKEFDGGDDGVLRCQFEHLELSTT
jgi:hypothetical protein